MRKECRTLCLAFFMILILAAQGSAAPEKKLFFTVNDGVMTWTPVRDEDGNWFMSFRDLVPGEPRTDGMIIENRSGKTYDLYMQAVPVVQDRKKDELLELISMEVRLDRNSLYRGTASGREYENGSLRDVIFLGTYGPGEGSEIAVDLQLSPETGTEHCDLLSRIDWKFMVTETTSRNGAMIPDSPGKGENSTGGVTERRDPPVTGDPSGTAFYILLMMISSGTVIIMKWVRSGVKKYE